MQTQYVLKRQLGGLGGIAVIRVSGHQALSLSRKLCPFLPKEIKARYAYFGSLKHKGRAIDEVVVLYFEQGGSFTSEETIEISCHGSPLICSEILQALQEEGCRLAQRGEFTYRAFMSGRIDLSQAESVLSLISAKSSAARRQALRLMKGELSGKIKKIKKKVKKLLSHIEASIDFSEENLTLMSESEILSEIKEIKKEANQMLKEEKYGRSLNEGLKIGIFGPPNSGKSTFLNTVLREDKAIVSATPGTTRDQVEGERLLKGRPFLFVDTAGVRKTSNMVEEKGLEKTLQTLDEADLCLYLHPADKDFSSYFSKKFFSDELFHPENKSSLKKENSSVLQKKHEEIYSLEERFFSKLRKRKNDLIFIVNKIDLKPKKEFLASVQKKTPWKYLEKNNHFFISAKTGEGIKEMENFFLKYVQENESITNLPRRYKHLKEICNCIQRAGNLASQPELLSFELKDILIHTQQLLGEKTDPDVLSEIFQQFCIGK